MRVLGGDPWRDAVHLHRRIAYVPGDVSLWPNLTGGQIIDILGGLRGGAYKARRDELLQRFELDPSKKARAYSKGNRQKVALVSALASDAELLILDEPTSGLDPIMEAAFRACLRDVRAQGRSVLLSSHIFAEVENLCDTVTIIRQGKTVESGTLAELRHPQRSTVSVILDDPSANLSLVPGVYDLVVEGGRTVFTVADADERPMTASNARATGGSRDTMVGRTPSQSSFQGLHDMVLFIARRNWLRLVVWAVVLVGMMPFVYESQRAAFPTAADREAYASIANTPSVAALKGTAYAASTLGGILVLKIWMSLAITLAFVTVFLVTRDGRADEEDGRTELLRSNVLGRHAYTLGNNLVVAAFNVVVGVGIAGSAMALSLPVVGSLVLCASLAGVGLLFLGVAAIGSQVSTTSRGANSFAAAVIGVAYVLRAIGDLNGSVTTPGWISWLSPIGWGQEMRAFGVNRWWPLTLLVLGAVLLGWTAVWVEARRDLGSGVLPDRPGPSVVGRFLQSPFGLTLRLQRGTILGWFASVVVMALLYGSVASAMVNVLGTNPVACRKRTRSFRFPARAAFGGASVQQCSTVVTLAPIRTPSKGVDSLRGHLASGPLRRNNGEHAKES